MPIVKNTPTETGFNFTDLVYNLPVAVYTCDKYGYINYYNLSAAALWGRIPEIGKDLWCGSWKIYYPDGTPITLDSCPMALTLKTGKSFEGRQITIERPDHTFRNLLVFPRPIFDVSNNLTGAHNTLVDITGQKQSEEKQGILSAIVESSDDAIISKTLRGIITSWNRGAEKIFGYNEKEAMGKPINMLIPPSLQSEEDIIIQNIRSGKKVDHFRTVRLAKSGKQIPVSLTISPVKDKEGNITGASKIARDISDQIEKEAVIKQGAQRLEILNSIGRAISEKLDVESILQRVTDATTLITGAAFGAFFYNTIDGQGKSFMLFTLSGATKEAFEKLNMPGNTELFNPTHSGVDVVRVDDITKDSRYSGNLPHQLTLNGEGNLSVLSYLAVPVVADSGTVLGGLFFGHPEPGVFNEEHEAIIISIASQASVALDNTKLFEEIKGVNAKKDEFIALASHELKTPLTTVKGYLQILQLKENDNVSRLFIDKSLKQVERLNSLVAELFDISKIEAGKLELNYENFDVCRLILDVIETFHYSYESHTIIFSEAEKVLIIEADKQRMEQVIINLLTNAVKYSPGAERVFVTAYVLANEAIVKVSDEGIGLSPEQQEKIFARFYRAEGNSNISGLGLGLYLTREIIDRHNGHITVTSELGKGSEFIFSVPLQKNKACSPLKTS